MDRWLAAGLLRHRLPSAVTRRLVGRLDPADFRHAGPPGHLDPDDQADLIVSCPAADAAELAKNCGDATLARLIGREERITVLRAMLCAHRIGPETQADVVAELVRRGDTVDRNICRGADPDRVAELVADDPTLLCMLYSAASALCDRLLTDDPSGRQLLTLLETAAETADPLDLRRHAGQVAAAFRSRFQRGETTADDDVAGAILAFQSGRTDPDDRLDAAKATRRLLTEPDLALEARLQLADDADLMLWLADPDSANPPRPGEVAALYRRIPSRTRSVACRIVDQVDLAADPLQADDLPWFGELVGCMPVANRMVQSPHRINRHVANRIVERLGDNPDAWDTLCALAGGFGGSVDELCDVATGVAENS